jgi:serine/threonine protein kinase/tetratricopeptide (TPR) repeat protein
MLPMIEAHHWQELKLIVANALERESTRERVDFVRRSCADDVELRQAAEYLLKKPEVFSRQKTDDIEECARSAHLEDPEIGRRIGAYVILRRLGEGGMGVVYLAARSDGCFEKQVAIKFLRSDARSEEALHRFCSEREVLARLDHPHIARLIDAGTTQEGVPYFIMEYVDGIPITDFVAQQSMTLSARLELFLKVTAAVQAAHERGIIHRDLKPSNIVVNPAGEPRLLDFGIAKLLAAAADPRCQTVSGRERLTPMFASPEQMRGAPVTIATDIYSLGIVLYEMVTGRDPFPLDSDRSSFPDLVATICEKTPCVPSRVTFTRINPRQLRGDLDAILLRAIEKEPTARYRSVAAFAEDIRRHLRNEPVQARSNQTIYRLARTAFRKRWLRVLCAISSLVLVGLGSVIFYRFHIAPGPRNRSVEGETSDIIAQRLFVQAWELAMTGSEPNSKDSLLKALPLIEQAIKRDPQFMRAYNLLALLHLDLYWQGFDHTPGRRDLARAAIEKAARWHPDSAEVHIARANLAYHGFRDYARARSELEIAHSKAPTNATVYSFIGSIDRRQGRWEEALRNFSRAVELDPGSFRFEEEEAFTYEALHRYTDARRAYERALSIVPQDYFIRAQLARLPFLERGDIKPLQLEIAAILKEQPAAAKEIANTLLDCSLIERDSALADRALATVQSGGLQDIYTSSHWSREWLTGLAANNSGDRNKATANFLLGRANERRVLDNQPDDAHAWSRLGLIDAALRNQADAIREGTYACNLLPLSRDAWDGAELIINLATIYAWLGERDLALEQLERVTQNPSQLSFGELARSPKWDSLRGDPRFQRIVQSFAPR